MIDVLIRYLGIKTKLLNHIDAVVSNELPNGCVLDLFSGSTIVAQKLMDRYTVYTNDIQQYSYCVSKATVQLNPNFDYSTINIDKIIRSNFFVENQHYLKTVWDAPLAYERQLIEKLIADIENEALLYEFKYYYENAPYVYDFNGTTVPECFKGMEDIYSKQNYDSLRREKSTKNYMLFTLNYAMPYFSLNQAIFIDSYRYAIDKLLEVQEISQTEYYVHISLLVYLLNNIVTSVGDHFAQPQQFKVSDEQKLKREVAKILKKKSLDVQACIREKCIEFQRLSANHVHGHNIAFCDDYKEVLEKTEVANNVDLIYIDPPYTNAHYSRFYHILETLVDYDYPELEFFGRYRNDRVQSSFCIRSKAIEEFDHMICKCAALKKIIVISYSDTKQCIVSKQELLDICKKYYSKVTINEQDYLYRNFGQKPNKVKGNELLIVCR